MSTNRFSSKLLHRLRNHVPINSLIKNELKIPCEITQGIFRFLCPLCNSFDTKTTPPKNLARCFKCQTSFNPIDMVIAVKKVNFVTAVNFLIKHINIAISSNSQQNNNTDHQNVYSTSTNTPFESKLIPINEIIPSIMKRAKSNESCCDGCLSLASRVEIAEKEVNQLKFQVSKLLLIIEKYL